MVDTQEILAAASQPWSHQSAYAYLKANAKHFAGLENARTLIRQSREIRYVRYVQLASAEAEEARVEQERTDSADEQVSALLAEGITMEHAA